MNEWLHNRLQGKSLILLGFGREGQATYRLIRKILPGSRIAIADRNEDIREHPMTAEDELIDYYTGTEYLKSIYRYDLIIRSPGIPIWNLDPQPERERITSQTDLFLQYFASQVTGITGTKGKSTTSSLIHHILQTAGMDSVLLGNIGNPAFHFTEIIRHETRIIFELSSHQLEYISRSPHIAILLNLFPEHLDACAGFMEYQKAKINITLFQQHGDFLIWHSDDPLITERLEEIPLLAHSYPFSLNRSLQQGCFVRGDEVLFSDGCLTKTIWRIHQDRFLRGEHNLKNILAAVTASILLKVDTEAIGEGISTFKGLEHRLEYVGEFRGIHFYNDSISTIPEACIEAVRSIPGVDTLIAGGFDRGIPYDSLAAFLLDSQVRTLVFIGAAGRRIGEAMEAIQQKRGRNDHTQKIFYINRFDDLREIVFRETRKDHACLLSPAAASYDEFNNFEERGKRFRLLVQK